MSDKADNVSTKRNQADLSASTLGKRIKEALGSRDFAWLSRETGISTSTLSDYGRGKLPRADKALQIAQALGVSFEQLMSETGEPLAMWDKPIPAPKVERADSVEVAEIDLRYGLGGTYLDEHVESESRTFSRAWLRNFTDSPPEQLFWAKGQGNSMEATIHENDIVLIDRRQQAPKMADLIWAFAWGQIGAIKRLRPMPDGSVKILSDNPAVPPDTAHDGELHIIGRVVAVVKRV
jgi:phage repressor protein C with HTH and peptisase S24 domain